MEDQEGHLQKPAQWPPPQASLLAGRFPWPRRPLGAGTAFCPCAVAYGFLSVSLRFRCCWPLCSLRAACFLRLLPPPHQLAGSVRSADHSSGRSFGSSIAEATSPLGPSPCFSLRPPGVQLRLLPWLLPLTRSCLGHPGAGFSSCLSIPRLATVLAGETRTKGLTGRVKNSGRQKEPLLSSAFSSGLFEELHPYRVTLTLTPDP